MVLKRDRPEAARVMGLLALATLLTVPAARADSFGLQAFASTTFIAVNPDRSLHGYQQQNCTPAPDVNGNCHEFVGDNQANGYNVAGGTPNASASASSLYSNGSAQTAYHANHASVSVDPVASPGSGSANARSVWVDFFDITGGTGTDFVTFGFQLAAASAR